MLLERGPVLRALLAQLALLHRVQQQAGLGKAQELHLHHHSKKIVHGHR